jgi:hypothetical protein
VGLTVEPYFLEKGTYDKTVFFKKTFLKIVVLQPVMIYGRMRYKVRHNGGLSEEFESLIGILAGDTISPLLWILYFSDFSIPESSDDVRIDGRAISHLEQADDLLLLALSPEGLQRKMNLFYKWCQENFMIINALKSFIGFHGQPPLEMPIFRFEDAVVEIVEEYVYVGMTFRSGNFRTDCFHSVLAPHYDT